MPDKCERFARQRLIHTCTEKTIMLSWLLEVFIWLVIQNISIIYFFPVIIERGHLMNRKQKKKTIHFFFTWIALHWLTDQLYWQYKSQHLMWPKPCIAQMKCLWTKTKTKAHWKMIAHVHKIHKMYCICILSEWY